VINETGYLVIVLFSFIYLALSCAFLTYHIVRDGFGASRDVDHGGPAEAKDLPG
jgi:hypothetical protein